MIADDRLALRRWMTAELSGLQDEADQLFGAVALEMPREPAPPAVLRRVEERLGWDVQLATHRPRARARRLAVAAALALAGVGFVVYGAVALAPLIASQLLSKAPHQLPRVLTGFPVPSVSRKYSTHMPVLLPPCSPCPRIAWLVAILIASASSF